MVTELRFWRDLPNNKKKEMITKYNLKAVTFSDIENIYKKEELKASPKT